MLINESKLNELEAKINSFGDILKDIRDELKSQSAENKVQTVVQTKESLLSEVERKKIEDIMENFNFDRVHDAMEAVDWRWVGTKYGVPTIDEIKAEARRILVDAVNERTCISTGGLRAVYEADSKDDTDPYIGLEFILVEWEGFVDDEDGDDDEYPSPWARGGAAE